MCRICFRPIIGQSTVNSGDKNQTAAYELIKETIKVVLPQLDLEICSNNVFCLKCVSLLHFSAELLETFKKTEDTLKNAIKTKKELTDKDADLVVVSQVSTEGNFDNNKQAKPVIITTDIINDILVKKSELSAKENIDEAKQYGVKKKKILKSEGNSGSNINYLQSEAVNKVLGGNDRNKSVGKTLNVNYSNNTVIIMSDSAVKEPDSQIIFNYNVAPERTQHSNKLCVLEGGNKSLYLQLKREAVCNRVGQTIVDSKKRKTFKT